MILRSKTVIQSVSGKALQDIGRQVGNIHSAVVKIRQEVDPLIPLSDHVDSLTEIGTISDNVISVAQTASDLLALAAETARILALSVHSDELSQIATNTASLLSLVANKPVFIPEYRAFVIPGE